MDPAVLRIIDANLNRAREGLRVLEDYARMILDDADRTARIKNLRHALASVAQDIGPSSLLAARDTLGDVGTRISVAPEHRRDDPAHVAVASSKRVAEALRCIEEYAKTANADIAQRCEKLRYDLYTIEQDMLLTGPRRHRLAQVRLHVLITESLCRDEWRGVCKKILTGGADLLQLREKDLSDAELLERARTLREMTLAHDTLLFINDRADIARLVGADGVHVGQRDLPVKEARRIAGPAVLVGKSTHSIAEAREAIAEAPDYLAVGPMFRSPTKPDVPVEGPTLLTHVAELTDLPLVAIGGITPQNVSQLRSPRPFAVAVSSAIIAAADPAAAVAAVLTSHPAPPLMNRNKTPGP